MNTERKWAHKLRFTKSKGMHRAFCTCGWQSQRSADEQAVQQAARAHSGLKEKERRPDAR